MGLWLDTRRNSSQGIALCARCSKKFPVGELRSDPNYPALMVCKDDLDEYDPYRLAARPTENLTLPFVRPDIPLVVDDSGLMTNDNESIIVEDGGEEFLDP